MNFSKMMKNVKVMDKIIDKGGLLIWNGSFHSQES